MLDERAQGRIEATLKIVSDRVERIDKKVDHLIAFKWKIIGGSVTLSFIAALMIEFLRLGGDK